MFAKLKDYIVVCIHNKTPLTGLELRRVQERITASKPHYWEEYEPGIFLAFFLIKRGGRTKSLKLTTSARLLRNPGTPFEGLGVDKAVGELVTESNWYGKILTCPFGDAVNQAIKKAREDGERGYSIRPKGEKRRGGMTQTRINILSVGGYAFMVTGILLLYFTGGLFAYEPGVIALQILATALMFWARITFGRRSFHLSANPTEGGLVTSGPYRYIRHPIYAAALLFAWSGLLAHFSLVSLCFDLLILAGALARIFCEESLVRIQYPEYNQYVEITKRLIPFLF